MAYVPTNWATGDVITAEKLNHIENGIASFIVNFKITVGVSNGNLLTISEIDKTDTEIQNAISENKRVIGIAEVSDGSEGNTSTIICMKPDFLSDVFYFTFILDNFNISNIAINRLNFTIAIMGSYKAANLNSGEIVLRENQGSGFTSLPVNSFDLYSWFNKIKMSVTGNRVGTNRISFSDTIITCEEVYESGSSSALYHFVTHRGTYNGTANAHPQMEANV